MQPSSRALSASILASAALVLVASSVACAVALRADGVGLYPDASGDDSGELASRALEPPCDGWGCGETADVCPALLARTCGGCAESAACAAATLLARYEPDGCAAALADEQTYPACTLSSCATLMKRVCGGAPPTAACVDNPGCGPAQVLSQRATDPAAATDAIAAAEASCAAALTDAAVFAACGS
ncbi:MAG: hypothetical protein FJ137_00315 [Deltaproteobacteria bacterium]|nr:hypothetical protein [Deltaproteobacteria bacterium]